MINKETIISVYNEKLTLLQWLKSVNKALDEAVLTGVEINQKGNATFTFLFTFEDDTQVESNEIVVNKGDSVQSASVVNGHLILTLTNDETIDAGNIKPVAYFSFDASRHLIVTYADGTNQDLGLIKGVSSFSISADQHLIVTYDNGTSEDLGSLGDYSNADFSVKTLTQSQANKDYNPTIIAGIGTITNIYNRVEVINQIMHVILNGKIEVSSDYNVSNGSVICYGNIDLTRANAEAIFDLAGNSAHATPANNTLITAIPVILYEEINASLSAITKHYGALEIINASTTVDRISVRIVSRESYTLSANSQLYFMGRASLTLI